MTFEQKTKWIKSKTRFRFRIAAFVLLSVQLIMAFVLAWHAVDLTGFAIVAGAVSTPMAALLVADYATGPKP